MCEVYSPLVTLGYSLMPSYLTDLDWGLKPLPQWKEDNNSDSYFSSFKKNIEEEEKKKKNSFLSGWDIFCKF